MANAAVAFNNRLVSGLASAGGSWSAAKPLANILDPTVKYTARTASAAMSATRFRLTLAAGAMVQAFDLKEHNLQPGARWRARWGTSIFDADYSDGAADERVTYGGATNGTRINELGNIVAASAGRLDHDPGVLDNGAIDTEDLSTSNWKVVSGAMVLSKTAVAMENGSQVVQFGRPVMPSQPFNVRVQCRLLAGNGDFKPKLSDGVSDFYPTPMLTALPYWTDVNSDITTGSGVAAGTNSGNLAFTKLTGYGIIEFRFVQYSSGAGVRPYRKPSTGPLFRRLGILREQTSNNLITQSGTIVAGTGNWVKGANLTANGVVGTLLGINAYSFTSTAAASSNIGATITGLSAGSTFTDWFLCDVNAGGSSYVRTNVTGTQFNYVYTLIAPGVYLASVSFVLPATDTGLTAYVGRIDAPNGTTFRVAAPMCENAVQRTSYIPTTTTGLTRTADTMSVAALSGLSANEVTLYTEFIPYTTLNGINVTSITLGSAANNVSLRALTNGAGAAAGDLYVTASSVATIDTAGFALTNGSIVRACGSCNSVNQWNHSVNGATVETASAAIPPFTSALDLAGGASLRNHLRRVTVWPHSVSDAMCQSIATSGPGALDYDSGWITASPFIPQQAEYPSQWGRKGYDLITVAPTAKVAKYLTVEIDDTTNADGYIELGRAALCELWQPAINPVYGGWQRGRQDLSRNEETPTGTQYSQVYRRRKVTVATWKYLTAAESRLLDEMLDVVGTTGEVIWLPDPNDMALCQDEGGLCLLSELSVVEHAGVDLESTSLKLKEKV